MKQGVGYITKCFVAFKAYISSSLTLCLLSKRTCKPLWNFYMILPLHKDINVWLSNLSYCQVPFLSPPPLCIFFPHSRYDKAFYEIIWNQLEREKNAKKMRNNCYRFNRVSFTHRIELGVIKICQLNTLKLSHWLAFRSECCQHQPRTWRMGDNKHNMGDSMGNFVMDILINCFGRPFLNIGKMYLLALRSMQETLSPGPFFYL